MEERVLTNAVDITMKAEAKAEVEQAIKFADKGKILTGRKPRNSSTLAES
jgi:hypothetical protein